MENETKTADYFSVDIASNSTNGVWHVTHSLLAYWYKESGIMLTLTERAEKIGIPDLCGSLLDSNLGKALDPEDKLFEEFRVFNESHGFGKFMLTHERIEYVFSRNTSWIKTRIYIDLGRFLKKTAWYKANVKALKRERLKQHKIKEVMES